MSPEQIWGEDLDARTNLFSFGLVLYKIAHGRQAFPGQTSGVILDAILNRDPVRPLFLESASAARGRQHRDQGAREGPSGPVSDGVRPGSGFEAAAARHEPGSIAEGFRRASCPRGCARAQLVAPRRGRSHRRRSLRAEGGSTAEQRTANAGVPGQTAIAVLPFQNLGADRDTDFLRIGLADEIVGTLSPVSSLAVRPSTMTLRYAAAGVDPQAAGRELRVAKLLTGHFQREGDRLRITVEAIDVESARTLWRDSVSVQPRDVIDMQKQIASRVRQGALPHLEHVLVRTNPLRRRHRTQRRTIYTFEAPRSPMMRVPTRRRSRCWNGRWSAIRRTRGRGPR